MSHVTCRLTAKNRDQLRKPTLGNRVWATFIFFTPRSLQSSDVRATFVALPDSEVIVSAHYCGLTTRTSSAATADGPRDELAQSKSRQLLHNCKNKLYNESTTSQSNGVRALRSTDVLKTVWGRMCITLTVQPRCGDFRKCGQQARQSTIFVNNTI